MKKEKSLIFLGSKWLILSCLMLGFVVFSSVDAVAQNSPLGEDIVALEQIRDTFAPATAKYDLVQDAIDYLTILDTNISADPNYLNTLNNPNNPNSTDTDPFEALPLRKIHPSILAVYTPSQLISFQTDLGAELSVNPTGPKAQKLQWIIDANAY